jgi:hypothetical protein
MAEAKRINRSTYGQYGLTTIDGYEVPYLSANVADKLVRPGEKWKDAAFGRGNYISDLGWSGNSFSNSLTRGAAAFGINKEEITPPALNEYGEYGYLGSGYSGIPSESPFGYKIVGDINAIAQKFGINTEGLKPYEKEVAGEIYEPDQEGFLRPTGRTDVITTPVGNEEGNVIGYKPVTRTVSVEEQIYDKINEATKDYYAYTGDTLVPGQANEGNPNSFQTVLYKKEGDVLKPITKPVEHGGWQNPDVYTGGGGFKLSELIRGVAPIAAFAIGAPFLDAALAGTSAAAQAATTAGTAAGSTAAGAAPTGSSLLSYVGLGAEGALPFTAAPGVASNIFTLAPNVAGTGNSMLSYLGLGAESQAPYTAAAGLPSDLFTISSGVPVYPGDEQYIAQDIMEQARATNVPAGSPTSWDTGIKPFITPGMAIQGARLGMGLLGANQNQQQQPQQQQTMIGGRQPNQYAGVDYSGLLNLLSPRMAQRNPNSLLG